MEIWVLMNPLLPEPFALVHTSRAEPQIVQAQIPSRKLVPSASAGAPVETLRALRVAPLSEGLRKQTALGQGSALIALLGGRRSLLPVDVHTCNTE